MILFLVLTCEVKSATNMLILIYILETQVTGQHGPLQINYLFSTKADLGSAQW